MRVKRFSILCLVMLVGVVLLSACTSPASRANPAATQPVARASATSGAVAKPTVGGTTAPTPRPSATPDPTPAQYKARLLLSGGGYRPDDLVFDPAGRLVFSDFYNGTISRLNSNGSVTTLLSGVAGPEGLVYLPDGRLIIAEQRTNRIVAFSSLSGSLTVLRVLPGHPSSLPCKDGVDGIALDPTTQTLIVPDSPTGVVYRMSLDGRKMSILAKNMTRPVGAAVDAQGNVYVADECGGALWKVATDGTITRTGGFGMLDDIAFDQQGNILVTDLKPSIHALIRLRLATGKREVLASAGYIEPQGLAVDTHGNLYLSDDYADKIVEYIPA